MRARADGGPAGRVQLQGGCSCRAGAAVLEGLRGGALLVPVPVIRRHDCWNPRRPERGGKSTSGESNGGWSTSERLVASHGKALQHPIQPTQPTNRRGSLFLRSVACTRWQCADRVKCGCRARVSSPSVAAVLCAVCCVLDRWRLGWSDAVTLWKMTLESRQQATGVPKRPATSRSEIPRRRCRADRVLFKNPSRTTKSVAQWAPALAKVNTTCFA